MRLKISECHCYIVSLIFFSNPLRIHLLSDNFICHSLEFCQFYLLLYSCISPFLCRSYFFLTPFTLSSVYQLLKNKIVGDR